MSCIFCQTQALLLCQSPLKLLDFWSLLILNLAGLQVALLPPQLLQVNAPLPLALRHELHNPWQNVSAVVQSKIISFVQADEAHKRVHKHLDAHLVLYLPLYMTAVMRHRLCNTRPELTSSCFYVTTDANERCGHSWFQYLSLPHTTSLFYHLACMNKYTWCLT